jgi:hypothetical protein
MPTIYPSLAIGAKRRLELFRREAAKPGWVRPMTWRDVRFAKLTSDSGLSRGFNPDGAVWYAFSAQFDAERDAHEVLTLRHTGYYTDMECDGRAIGIVAKLPHGRWLAGYRWTDNDERVYYGHIYDSENDAAHAADSHAESFAELQRESDERFMEMTRAEGRVEECESEVRNAWDARHASAYWREYMRDRIANLKEARADLERAKRDYAS